MYDSALQNNSGSAGNITANDRNLMALLLLAKTV